MSFLLHVGRFEISMSETEPGSFVIVENGEFRCNPVSINEFSAELLIANFLQSRNNKIEVKK